VKLEKKGEALAAAPLLIPARGQARLLGNLNAYALRLSPSGLGLQDGLREQVVG
jgi:hypothetical protein